MCFNRLKHFTGVLLLFSILHSIPLGSVIIADSTTLSSSEEIKKIFSNTDVSNISVLKGISNSGNFAEGGRVNINGITPKVTFNVEKPFIKKEYSVNLTSSQKNILQNESTIQFQDRSFVNSSDNKSADSLPFAFKNQIPTKLNETGSNLFLGVPEVVHINGTSSIKPRKGVYYNKIVPRKGVDNDNDNENEGSHSPNNPAIPYCFWMSQDECYSVEEVHDFDCSCCEEGNLLGKKIKQQPILNCKNCKPVNLSIYQEKHPCKNICCTKKLFVNETYLVSTTEDIFDSYINDNTKKKNLFSIQKEKLNKTIIDSKKLRKEDDKTHKNSTKSFKRKPSITKVPYDIEVMPELLSEAKQKVFLPVVVSIFLLPLIGILIFFIWRRTKEFWDKRHYRKMDFLIDGIYND